MFFFFPGKIPIENQLVLSSDWPHFHSIQFQSHPSSQSSIRRRTISVVNFYQGFE